MELFWGDKIRSKITEPNYLLKAQYCLKESPPDVVCAFVVVWVFAVVVGTDVVVVTGFPQSEIPS